MTIPQSMTAREKIIGGIEQNQHRTFLIDAITGRKITYGEFHNHACSLAAELRRRGLSKGDRVAVMIPNCWELAVLYFACIYLGAVIVPINPSLSKGDVQFILNSCKPGLVIVSAPHARLMSDFHEKVLTLSTTHRTVADPSERQAIGIDSLPADSSVLPLEASAADDLIAIMYTSGTSAKPKGLAHRIGGMFRNAAVFAGIQGIDENSRFYLTLSMAYMGGFYNLLVLPFLCGASVVLDQVFDARSSLYFWEKARTHEVNTLWMAPTVLSILLRMDRGRAGEEFCRNSVRQVFVGFAPLPSKVKDEFESRYGVKLIENYGLSETLFVTARSQQIIAGRGYVGEALPGIQLRIVNEESLVVAPGLDGEVEILTPSLMAGYLDSDGKLLAIDASQWFPTGDVGHLDGPSLFITGRKKDIIIRGGVNISPAAIEDSLAQVSGVCEVAVVSIPHELYGEDIVAVVKLEPAAGFEPVVERLTAHAKANLAQHQQPARYIDIDEMPRTANGKVQKERLRELVAGKLQMGVGPARPAPETMLRSH